MNRKKLIAILICIVAAALFITACHVKNTVDGQNKDTSEESTDTGTGESTEPTDIDGSATPPEETDNITGGNEADNTVYNTEIPTSYKDFALTRDMSAKEAYEYIDGFLSSKYSILTNKQNKVGSDYAPSDLVVPEGCEYKLERTAAAALTSMLRAARNDGVTELVLYSGYRTYASQKNKYENRIQRYLNEGYSASAAEEKAGEYIAPPGSSEHHTGLAADVCSYKTVSKYGYLDDSFDQTAGYRWLRDHCAEYGFIMRYRKDAESVTGFLYEPWHYRYIGVDHAKACTALQITYEEYYDMLVRFRDEAKAQSAE